jgi:hypothetical protein
LHFSNVPCFYATLGTVPDVALAGDEGFYDGEARPEMKQFYDGYAADIDKLSYFESVAGHYLTLVFDDFTFTDQDLAAIVTAWLGEH